MALAHRSLVRSALLVLLDSACSSNPVRKPAPHGAAGSPSEQSTSSAGDSPGGSAGTSPSTLAVPVSASRITYVKLATPAIVEVTDPAHSMDWDLAFVGYNVFTNGGLSGSGKGSAFGPVSVALFGFLDLPVEVPFLIPDEAASAFVDWYAYESSTHELYSRYHVYGLSSGGRRYKLQVLGYYGSDDSMPVSGLYQLRYAEVTADGSGDTVELENVDATLDGAAPGPDVPSACLVLATGKTPMLTPNEAAASTAWDVCFQRDAIDVNGGVGGPGDVTAVDLEAADTAGEALSDVEARTADNQASLFDGIDFAALSSPDLDYRGDDVISAFTGQWADLSADPPVPTPAAAFLVVGADGSSRYLVAFDAFDGADSQSPGTVELGVAPSVSP